MDLFLPPSASLVSLSSENMNCSQWILLLTNLSAIILDKNIFFKKKKKNITIQMFAVSMIYLFIYFF